MNSSFSHVALLVSSVERSAKVLAGCGIKTGEPEIFESEGTQEIYVGTYAKNCGLLLLLQSIGPGPYQRAFEKRGPSLHHLAIDVLDLDECLSEAQAIGWSVHPVSTETKALKTAWLFRKGVPALIEVAQKKELSRKELLVSRVELPIKPQDLAFFDGLGLGGIVATGNKTGIQVRGQEFSLDRLVR